MYLFCPALHIDRFFAENTTFQGNSIGITGIGISVEKVKLMIENMNSALTGPAMLRINAHRGFCMDNF